MATDQTPHIFKTPTWRITAPVPTQRGPDYASGKSNLLSRACYSPGLIARPPSSRRNTFNSVTKLFKSLGAVQTTYIRPRSNSPAFQNSRPASSLPLCARILETGRYQEAVFPQCVVSSRVHSLGISRLTNEPTGAVNRLTNSMSKYADCYRCDDTDPYVSFIRLVAVLFPSIVATPR